MCLRLSVVGTHDSYDKGEKIMWNSKAEKLLREALKEAKKEFEKSIKEKNCNKEQCANRVYQIMQALELF